MGINVAPRYTSGSPGVVDEATAWHVAQGEVSMYQNLLDGHAGEEERTRAVRLGLERIVYRWKDSGKYRFTIDLITGRKFRIHLEKSNAWRYWYQGDVDAHVLVEVEPGVYGPAGRHRVDGVRYPTIIPVPDKLQVQPRTYGAWLDSLEDPNLVGSAEYRVLHELLTDMNGNFTSDGELMQRERFEHIETMLDEVISVAQRLKAEAQVERLRHPRG